MDLKSKTILIVKKRRENKSLHFQVQCLCQSVTALERMALQLLLAQNRHARRRERVFRDRKNPLRCIWWCWVVQEISIYSIWLHACNRQNWGRAATSNTKEPRHPSKPASIHSIEILCHGQLFLYRYPCFIVPLMKTKKQELYHPETGMLGNYCNTKTHK